MSTANSTGQDDPFSSCQGTPEISHLLALIMFDRCEACGRTRVPPYTPRNPLARLLTTTAGGAAVIALTVLLAALLVLWLIGRPM